MSKKIGMASDHAGYEMKDALKKWLEEKGYEIVDFGACSAERCDYPDFAHPLGKAIDSGELTRGIALCGSGNGISMTLNKHQSVRAALCWNTELATLARQHNDANILSIPARFVDLSVAKDMVDVFLSTDFEGGRHEARIKKIPLA